MTSQNKNHAVITALIHTIFIVLMFFLPDLLHHYTKANGLWNLSIWSFARSAVLIFVFYNNYLIVIPQLLLKRRRWVPFVLVNLAVCFAAALLMRYLGHLEHLEWVANASGEMARPQMGLPTVDLVSFILRDFIATFVELMRLRMPDRTINFSVDNQAPGATIAPLVFITQVENAFKHGNTANHSEPIDITIRANDECIECLTTNGIDRKACRDSGHGVGLSNLRRRLEIIYGDAAALHIDIVNNQYITHLIINR